MNTEEMLARAGRSDGKLGLSLPLAADKAYGLARGLTGTAFWEALDAYEAAYWRAIKGRTDPQAFRDAVVAAMRSA